MNGVAFGSTLSDLQAGINLAQAQQQQAQLAGQELALRALEQDRLNQALQLGTALDLAALQEERRQADLSNSLARFQQDQQNVRIANQLAFDEKSLAQQGRHSERQFSLAEIAEANRNTNEQNRLAEAVETRKSQDRIADARIAEDARQFDGTVELERELGLLDSGGGVFGDAATRRRFALQALLAARRANDLLGNKDANDSATRAIIARQVGTGAQLLTVQGGKFVPDPALFGAGTQPPAPPPAAPAEPPIPVFDIGIDPTGRIRSVRPTRATNSVLRGIGGAPRTSVK